MCNKISKYISSWRHNRKLKFLISEKMLLEAKLKRAKAEVGLYSIQLKNISLDIKLHNKERV